MKQDYMTICDPFPPSVRICPVLSQLIYCHLAKPKKSIFSFCIFVVSLIPSCCPFFPRFPCLFLLLLLSFSPSISLFPSVTFF
ncbi:hypothetical protein FKM82_011575 [Ascaphus truei]